MAKSKRKRYMGDVVPVTAQAGDEGHGLPGRPSGPRDEPRPTPLWGGALHHRPGGIEEIDEDEGDEFEEEEPDEEEDDEVDDDKGDGPPEGIKVEIDDPELMGFLVELRDDPATGRALADWLSDRDDVRAGHVRELAEARCVVPEGDPQRWDPRPMACGRWWQAVLMPSMVTGTIYPGTAAYPLACRAGCGAVSSRLPRGWTADQAVAAFERVRVALVLACFGLTGRMIRDRAVITREKSMDRVAAALGRCKVAAAPWLCGLRSSDPKRFAQVMELIASRDDLRSIAESVMDSVSPGWRQEAARRLARGATPADA